MLAIPSDHHPVVLAIPSDHHPAVPAIPSDHHPATNISHITCTCSEPRACGTEADWQQNWIWRCDPPGLGPVCLLSLLFFSACLLPPFMPNCLTDCLPPFLPASTHASTQACLFFCLAPTRWAALLSAHADSSCLVTPCQPCISPRPTAPCPDLHLTYCLAAPQAPLGTTISEQPSGKCLCTWALGMCRAVVAIQFHHLPSVQPVACT